MIPRVLPLLATLLVAACSERAQPAGSTETPTPSEDEVIDEAPPWRPTLPDRMTLGESDPRYAGDSDVTAAGLSFRGASTRRVVERFGPQGPVPWVDGYVYLCGRDPSFCACQLPLTCEQSGDCITFDRNIEIFREALASTGEHTVYCEHAETGHCGAFRYFWFVGDIHRDEIRWFGPDGKLVGMRSTTDYSAYCNGTAVAEWAGHIPKCESPTRDELICGDERGTVRLPLEELRRLTSRGRIRRADQPQEE